MQRGICHVPGHPARRRVLEAKDGLAFHAQHVPPVRHARAHTPWRFTPSNEPRCLTHARAHTPVHAPRTFIWGRGCGPRLYTGYHGPKAGPGIYGTGFVHLVTGFGEPPPPRSGPAVPPQQQGGPRSLAPVFKSRRRGPAWPRKLLYPPAVEPAPDPSLPDRTIPATSRPHTWAAVICLARPVSALGAETASPSFLHEDTAEGGSRLCRKEPDGGSTSVTAGHRLCDLGQIA